MANKKPCVLEDEILSLTRVQDNYFSLLPPELLRIINSSCETLLQDYKGVDELLKVAVVGPGGVGKTSLITCLAKYSTVGEVTVVNVLLSDRRIIRLHLWDCNQSMRAFAGSSGCVVVHSNDGNQVDKWDADQSVAMSVSHAKSRLGAKGVVMICIHKSDLSTRTPNVPDGCQALKTSVKDPKSVRLMFVALIEEMLAKRAANDATAVAKVGSSRAL